MRHYCILIEQSCVVSAADFRNFLTSVTRRTRTGASNLRNVRHRTINPFRPCHPSAVAFKTPLYDLSMRFSSFPPLKTYYAQLTYGHVGIVNPGKSTAMGPLFIHFVLITGLVAPRLYASGEWGTLHVCRCSCL